MTRFAAIDIGSNAMRCLIAEVGADGLPRVLESMREPVRLGSHVFLSGRIGAVTAERTIEAFRLFRRLIDNHGATHIRAIATSAAREAADAEEVFGRVLTETGIDVRVISGSEEAHLVRKAVASRLDLSRGRTAAVDVGGGSVEVLAIRNGDVIRAESFNIGAVRLLDSLPGPGKEGGSDFPTLLEEYVEAIRSRVLTSLGKRKAKFVAATGGSIETLAELAGEPAEGWPALAEGVRQIPLTDLHSWSVRLAGLSYKERVEQLGLRPDRADVILPAAVVYLKIADMLGVDRVFVPFVGLKDGLLLDMVEELEMRGAVKTRRREIRSAAVELGRRFAFDRPHAEKVTELALVLFDQLEALHGEGDEARTLLEAAGLLHDIGLYVSTARHHKHSYYLISESELVGLDGRQRAITANVARYHRRRHPTRKHPPFEALAPEDRETVRKLAAILRVADVLDREHRQRIDAVTAVATDDTLRLEVVSEGELLLEQWAAKKKFALFEEVFGLRPEIVRVDGESEV